MRLICLSAGVLILLALGPMARAQTDYTINYGFDTTTAASFNINYLQNNGAGSAASVGAYAGPFSATWGSAPPAGYSTNPFSVYCVDLDHYDTSSSTIFVKPFSTTANGDISHSAAYWNNLRKASWLYSQYNSVVQNDSAAQKKIDGAALQAAIWNVIDGDTDYKVETGNFNVTFLSGYGTNLTTFNSIVNQADTWLDALKNANPGVAAGTLFQVDRLQSGGQDMLGPAAVTPEGSSLFMFAFGMAPLAGLGWLGRRLKSSS